MIIHITVKTSIAGIIDHLVDDNELSADMGRAGRECVERKWTWDRSIRQLEEVLEEVAAR